MLFSAQNLPAFIKGSDGVAYPADNVEVLACPVPCRAEFPLPAAWGGGTKMVDAHQGYWIIAQDAYDIYPDNEFEFFYELGEQVDRWADPRARKMRDFWKALGQEVPIYVATKIKPTIVVGIIEEDFGSFETAEGSVTFKRGDVLLESPINRGQMWPIDRKVFNKKYQGILLSPTPV